ncbi:MAG: RICIN domain-containing protein [Oscillospiraceae bacterium]|nr:RICIN domain-containing protein [Oscillospiraceae bacterium]
MKRFISAMICLVLVFCTVFIVIPVEVSAGPNDTLGLMNNWDYYIKNVSTGRYLTADGSTPTSGLNVLNLAFTGAANQKWGIVQNSDGSYSLRSAMGVYKYALDVTGTNVDFWLYGGFSNDQHFDLTRYTNGTHLIKNISRGTNGYVHVSGTDVITNSSTYSTAWWSFELVTRGDASLYDFNITAGSNTQNTTGVEPTFTSFTNAGGYNKRIRKNDSVDWAFNSLRTDQISVFYGHATAGYFPFFNPSTGIESDRITGKRPPPPSTAIVWPINELPVNQLANLRCVLFVGCKTGLTDPILGNLVNEAYNKGAHFALGFKTTVHFVDGYCWVPSFLAKAATGEKINECIYQACKDSPPRDYWLNGVHVVTPGLFLADLYYTGDEYARLKH